MSIVVFTAVIGAALLHALWNALVKGGTDKQMSMGAVVLGHMPFALVSLLYVPKPALASFPYLVAGIALHVGYQLFLLRSYEKGDLTQVYPIARGSAPLIVALISLTILGVHLSSMELLALIIIGVGIISLALVRRENGQYNANATMLALLTGCFIASYSVIDGLGARIAGTSLGFYSWLAIGNGIVMVLYLTASTPAVLGKIIRQGRAMFLIGGGASFAAYGLVTWAFTQAPIALVAALRETSIIFTLLIGVFVLRERLDLLKLASTVITLLGAVLMRYSKH